MLLAVWQIVPQSVAVVPMPKMALPPRSWMVAIGEPPPDEQEVGTVAKAPVSPITWSGMLATASPAMAKSAWRTEPKA